MGQANPVQLTGRNTQYLRIISNQAIAANAAVTVVVATGSGTHALQAGWSAAANISVDFYGCDADGNALESGQAVTASQSSTHATVTNSEWGGAPYVAIVILEKSGAANNINFIDFWWTLV